MFIFDFGYLSTIFGIYLRFSEFIFDFTNLSTIRQFLTQKKLAALHKLFYDDLK